MTRRAFLWMAAAAAGVAADERLRVPLHRVTDARAPTENLHLFWWRIWPEAYGELLRSGIELQTSDGAGAVRLSPGDNPVLSGLRGGVINLVLTDHIPMAWDQGRALAGVTTVYDGYHVCLIALRYAHGNQIPLLSVNTCVHELLHALFQDILVSRPGWFESREREARVNWEATRLWLFHDGAAVRRSARVYLDRLSRAAAGA